jgi:hypothetical protein
MVMITDARTRIRQDAQLLQWDRQRGDYGTDIYILGCRAINVDYRRDGAVNWAKYYPDFRAQMVVEWAPDRNKKEYVLSWLAGAD